MDERTLALVIVALIIGLVIGAGLAWLLLPAKRNQRQAEQEREALEHELAQYRRNVDAHFVRTAELVNKMTDAYRAVHEELAQGAQSLCTSEARYLHVESAPRLSTKQAPAAAPDTPRPAAATPDAAGSPSPDSSGRT